MIRRSRWPMARGWRKPAGNRGPVGWWAPGGRLAWNAHNHPQRPTAPRVARPLGLAVAHDSLGVTLAPGPPILRMCLRPGPLGGLVAGPGVRIGSACGVARHAYAPAGKSAANSRSRVGFWGRGSNGWPQQQQQQGAWLISPTIQQSASGWKCAGMPQGGWCSRGLSR